MTRSQLFGQSLSGQGFPKTGLYELDLVEGQLTMLWTIFVILLVLWALGLASGTTLNGFIHLLLIIAVVVVLIRIIQGRKPF